MERSKLDRLVEARLALRARFEQKMRESPSQADPSPLGVGPNNRHGMPEIPAGQVQTHKWPVLDLGVHPEVAPADWQLVIDGACAHPTRLSFQDFMSLEQVSDTSDFHCVTSWSRLNLSWKGVRLADLLALVEPAPTTSHLLCHGYDGYSTNVSLTEALKPDVLLVHTVDGVPLPREHGGPVRMITPQLYAWKGAKWVSRLELLNEDRPGFWEERGYSMTAYPWRNDRYR